MGKKTKRKVLKAHFRKLSEKLNHYTINVYTLGGKELATPNGMPSSVRILGQKYQVYYHTKIYAEPISRTRLRGIVVYDERIIVLDPMQTIHDLRETLYHEMAHVYLRNNQSRGSSLIKLSPAQVEEVCDLFAEGHYDAISCE